MERLALVQSLRFRRAELGACVRESNLQKTLRVSAFSAGAVLLLGLVMFNLQNPEVSKINVDSAPAVAAASSSPSAISPILGINIANDGSVVVRGARVVEVSDNTITADISWGSAGFVWIAETSRITKFINNQGQKQTIADVKVGDIVTITGKLIKSGERFTADARFVRIQ